MVFYSKFQHLAVSPAVSSTVGFVLLQAPLQILPPGVSPWGVQDGVRPADLLLEDLGFEKIWPLAIDGSTAVHGHVFDFRLKQM